ncbi:taperin [Tamandua tetradactyla]|uniref:taperin n=1 Tax=Tamandua tetradactyla TaxID=48850 RepID=UPI0040548A64
MAGVGRPGSGARGVLPAWKREVLERKRAKLAALGGDPGQRPGAGPGEGAERLVLDESLGPLRENPFMRLEAARRRGAGSAGRMGPGARPVLELCARIPGVRTLRADRVLIIESAPGLAPPPPPRDRPTTEIRAAEVLVYEAVPPPGRVSRLLEKFDSPPGAAPRAPAPPRRRASPARARLPPPPPPAAPGQRLGERAAWLEPERGAGSGAPRSAFVQKTGSNSFTVHPRGRPRGAGERPFPNGPTVPESPAGLANGLAGSLPSSTVPGTAQDWGDWKPKVESGEHPLQPRSIPGTPSATAAVIPAFLGSSPASATPSQRRWVSAATSANDSFEIRPAPKPDLESVPAGDLQARALASLRMNSRNSFVFVPKHKAPGACPSRERQSLEPPKEQVGWASQPQEPAAQLVPEAGVPACPRSPLGQEELCAVEQRGSPRAATALANRVARWQRPSSPPPSLLAPTKAEPAEGLQAPGLAKNGWESGRPGLPITFIDEVDSEEEASQEAKLSCPGAGVLHRPHSQPAQPEPSPELYRRSGSTFTVVPRGRLGVPEDQPPGGQANGVPQAALGTMSKKRYPSVHEIEVIGGYLALEKSCLTKAGSSRKKMKISFNDKSLQTTFEYPSESSLVQEEEADRDGEGQQEEEEDEQEEPCSEGAAERPFGLFLPRAKFVNSVGPEGAWLPDSSSGLSSYTPKHSVAFSKWPEQMPEPALSEGEPLPKEIMLTPASQSDLSDFRSEPALYF